MTIDTPEHVFESRLLSPGELAQVIKLLREEHQWTQATWPNWRG